MDLAGQQRGAQSPAIPRLPDNIVATILLLLPLADKFRAALVCRQWLCMTRTEPRLWDGLASGLKDPFSMGEGHQRDGRIWIKEEHQKSWVAWLARHAAVLRSLSWTADLQAEACTPGALCLAHLCGATGAGALVNLDLEVLLGFRRGCPTYSGWGSSSDLCMAALGAMQHLTRLALGVIAVEEPPQTPTRSHQLPPAFPTWSERDRLTAQRSAYLAAWLKGLRPLRKLLALWLCIVVPDDEERWYLQLPAQLAALDRLVDLQVETDAFLRVPGWCSCLTALTRLSLGMRALNFSPPRFVVGDGGVLESNNESPNNGCEHALQAVLSPLQQLSQLSLRMSAQPAYSSFPGQVPSLAALTSLEVQGLLEITTWDLCQPDGRSRGSTADAAQLPALRRLRLADCRLAALPRFVYSLPLVEELDLAGNAGLELSCRGEVMTAEVLPALKTLWLPAGGAWAQGASV